MSKKLVTFDIEMSYNILSKNKAKEIKRLSSKKERDAMGLFLAEGKKTVFDLMSAFTPEYVVCTHDWAERHKEFCFNHKDVLLLSDTRGLELISTLNSVPEVVAVFKKPAQENRETSIKEDALNILLDDIQDPGNLGTIIRTCDWFGVYNIFASRHTVDVYSPKVVKATMGSLARVKVTYTDLQNLIETHRDIKVIGTLLNGIPLDKAKLSKKGFLLLGNEGNGISEELKKYIDLPLTIPPVNPDDHPDSLNVAIAAAIVISRMSQD